VKREGIADDIDQKCGDCACHWSHYIPLKIGKLLWGKSNRRKELNRWKSNILSLYEVEESDGKKEGCQHVTCRHVGLVWGGAEKRHFSVGI
jgi:hypothetical protein